MSTTALAGLAAEWITPGDQAGEDIENPTRYKIKPLNGLEFLEVVANGTHNNEGEFMPDHKGRLILLRLGVKDWENVTDASGENYVFNVARIKYIPMPHLIELVNTILERSALGAEAEKN